MFKICDYRHHAPEISPKQKAAQLLEKLARQATSPFGHPSDRDAYYQRNRAKFPNVFANRPGAFIQERCSAEDRELLGHLASEQVSEQKPDHVVLLGINRPYSPFGPPTTWKLTSS